MQSRVNTPLIDAPPRLTRNRKLESELPLTLPKRSQRQATMALANVPPARRAEVLLSQRLGTVKDKDKAPSTSRQALDRYFGNGKLPPSHRDAVNHLFPSLGRIPPSMGVLAA